MFKLNKTDAIDAEIKNLENKISAKNKQRDKLLSNSKLTCRDNYPYGKGCGLKTKLNNLTYIITHYYIPPRGCSGGAYYAEGEGNWVCSHCNHRNRMIDDSEKVLENFKHLFMKVEEEYDE